MSGLHDVSARLLYVLRLRVTRGCLLDLSTF